MENKEEKRNKEEKESVVFTLVFDEKSRIERPLSTGDVLALKPIYLRTIGTEKDKSDAHMIAKEQLGSGLFKLKTILDANNIIVRHTKKGFLIEIKSSELMIANVV